MKWYSFKMAILAGLIVMLVGCASLESSNPRSRVQALAQVNDQALLAQIALEGKYADVRRAAVGKLTDLDQSLLAKIAVEDKDADVRSAAVGKLTDRSLLAKIAVEDKDANVRGAAASKLTEQKLVCTAGGNAQAWYISFEKGTVRGETDDDPAIKETISFISITPAMISFYDIRTYGLGAPPNIMEETNWWTIDRRNLTYHKDSETKIGNNQMRMKVNGVCLLQP